MMNLGQSIVTGVVVAVGFFLICFFVAGIFSDGAMMLLFLFSVLAGLIVTCTSLIIYEIGKLKEDVAQNSSSCD